MGRPFVKLADPQRYVAASWDLAVDSDGRDYWVGLFKRNLRTILRHGVECCVARGETPEEAAARAEACATEFDPTFDDFRARPGDRGRVTILTLDNWRDGLLRKHGFVDPFLAMKDRENERMLPLLPEVCRRIDGLSDVEQVRAVIEGVFAGNLFDMGAEATALSFSDGKNKSFEETRRSLPGRPWRIDDFDALAERVMTGPPYRKSVFFVDNAGSDFILGAVPMMRWLARLGSKVVLAANERPTLNDMTIHDVHRWWPRIIEAEPSLRDLPIQPVSTGTSEPLIDLSDVSDELNDAGIDADLVILEGMGRGVESNLDAGFSCDALNLAMLKDPAVAARVGGRIYDVVCRFRGGVARVDPGDRNLRTDSA